MQLHSVQLLSNRRKRHTVRQLPVQSSHCNPAPVLCRNKSPCYRHKNRWHLSDRRPVYHTECISQYPYPDLLLCGGYAADKNRQSRLDSCGLPDCFPAGSPSDPAHIHCICPVRWYTLHKSKHTSAMRSCNGMHPSRRRPDNMPGSCCLPADPCQTPARCRAHCTSEDPWSTAEQNNRPIPYPRNKPSNRRYCRCIRRWTVYTVPGRNPAVFRCCWRSHTTGHSMLPYLRYCRRNSSYRFPHRLLSDIFL